MDDFICGLVISAKFVDSHPLSCDCHMLFTKCHVTPQLMSCGSHFMSCDYIHIAILCAASPDVPFMADESLQTLPGMGKLTYTLKQYITYASTLQEKARQLSKTG